jgi:diguanylate cyclase (GGDEF)-like protein
VTQLPDRGEYSALNDRMGYLFAIRIALALVTAIGAAARPEAVGVPVGTVLTVTAMYAAVSVVLELGRHRSARHGYALLTVMLLIDGVYLAAATYATGGTQSPFRFLIYLHLVAVSLLASYRTGLKIALWHSLLLFVVLYAQAANLLPPVDVVPGRAIEFDRMPVVHVTSFWLFALATSIFSAINERELRQRRADLQAMVDVGARLDEARDPVVQSRIVLDGLVAHFGFSRGLILGVSDAQVLALASHNTEDAPTTKADPDAIVRRAWDGRRPIPFRRLDPLANPYLAALLPGAQNLLVTPMIADGRPVGAIVLEQGGRRLFGIERRIVSVVGQLASIGALNLRNAVLLCNVQDLAERDSLTGAANRHMFQVSLERVLDPETAPHGTDRVSAILFIDLDDFKVVNDSLGHAAGDALLVAVTERIDGLVRDTDLVARLGGDEFAILTSDKPDLARSRSMAERLVRELRAPYLIDDKLVSVSASIGIASARDAIDGARDMVRNADVAMYMAKANGKAGFAVFDPGMHAAIRDRHELASELQRAVELDQLRLVYQPIVELETRRMAGAEALVRWDHPERGTIAPGQFIEIAEENGSILPIGRWVLREACRQTGAWQREGAVPEDMFLSVNVSAREIQQAGFVEGVRETLDETGIDPRRLVLEITETALLRATPATVATLDDLRGLGVRVVIDDFGTGYFSLSHLRQFPVDLLKIASEFVQGSDTGDRSSALAGAIVALGRSLDISTVAEGIETVAQAERMRALGCTYGQGYLFSRPLGGSQFRSQAAESAAAAAVVSTAPEPEPAPGRESKRRTPRASRRGANGLGRLAPEPNAG